MAFMQGLSVISAFEKNHCILPSPGSARTTYAERKADLLGSGPFIYSPESSFHQGHMTHFLSPGLGRRDTLKRPSSSPPGGTGHARLWGSPLSKRTLPEPEFGPYWFLVSRVEVGRRPAAQQLHVRPVLLPGHPAGQPPPRRRPHRTNLPHGRVKVFLFGLCYSLPGCCGIKCYLIRDLVRWRQIACVRHGRSQMASPR